MPLQDRAQGVEQFLVGEMTAGLERIARDALSSANTYRRAATKLAAGATAPLASWQALRNAAHTILALTDDSVHVVIVEPGHVL